MGVGLKPRVGAPEDELSAELLFLLIHDLSPEVLGP